MVRSTLRISLALGLAVSGLAAVAPAATAAERASGWTVIKLNVVRQDGGQARTATLTCYPAGGTHPEAEVACAELAKVNGAVKQVPSRPGWGCLPSWEPVDVTVTGFWRGRPIEPYSETFPHSSCAAVAHGHVLDF